MGRVKVKLLQLKRFSDRLSSLYSSWNKHLSQQWMNAKLIVVCTPPSPTDVRDPDLDSTKFFEWLFGDWVQSTYIIFSPTKIYAVCSSSLSWYVYDADLLRCFADEAKRTVGVDFVVKDKGSARPLLETLEEIVDGISIPVLPLARKGKGKNVVGFIGEESLGGEPTKWIEWKDVTDAFFGLAGIK